MGRLTVKVDLFCFLLSVTSRHFFAFTLVTDLGKISFPSVPISLILMELRAIFHGDLILEQLIVGSAGRISQSPPVVGC